MNFKKYSMLIKNLFWMKFILYFNLLKIQLELITQPNKEI